MGPSFKVLHAKDIVRLIIAVLIPLAVGGLAAFLSQNSREVYASLVQPPLSPPGAVFPIVWSILYVLMGIASFLVYRKGTENPAVRDGLIWYALSLALNFLWPILYFRFGFLLLAFIEILALWLVVGITAIKFYNISKTAGFLMLPYWLWVTFAAYLNLGTWLLNR